MSRHRARLSRSWPLALAAVLLAGSGCATRQVGMLTQYNSAVTANELKDRHVPLSVRVADFRHEAPDWHPPGPLVLFWLLPGICLAVPPTTAINCIVDDPRYGRKNTVHVLGEKEFEQVLQAELRNSALFQSVMDRDQPADMEISGRICFQATYYPHWSGLGIGICFGVLPMLFLPLERDKYSIEAKIVVTRVSTGQKLLDKTYATEKKGQLWLQDVSGPMFLEGRLFAELLLPQVIADFLSDMGNVPRSAWMTAGDTGKAK